MTTNKFKFECGCEFDIIGPAKYGFKIPRLKIDFLKLPYSCPKTWELASSGKTIGCFQIESPLGRQITKKVIPTNIEHLAAISSIMRPGVLKSFLDGKSLTDHYADRKNGRESLKPYHPVVDGCLEETYGNLVYQEQAILLAKEVAGFSLEEADSLRKAIGKKIASEMAKVKILFYEKAKQAKILSDEQIEQVFGWIQESQRYSFNKSILSNTIVETEEGLKTIEELKVGESIKAPKDNKTDEFIEVIEKYDHGYQDVFEITLQSGKTIICTMEHKFLTEINEILPLAEILLRNLSIMAESDSV